MKDEVRSAIKFLTEVLSRNSKVNQEQIQTFQDTLEGLIIARFENHWHPNKPLKGNAFRYINIEMTGIDPVLLKATKASGISPSVLLEIFPGGLALWIDPGEVPCRIGKGSICHFIVTPHNNNNSKVAIVLKSLFNPSTSTRPIASVHD